MHLNDEQIVMGIPIKKEEIITSAMPVMSHRSANSYPFLVIGPSR